MVVEVRRTERFAGGLDALGDVRGRARIQARIERLAAGNPGDVAPVGEGVSELRIDVGPGYRVYFTRRGRAVIILLAGGSKHTQTAAIRARRPQRSRPRPSSFRVSPVCAVQSAVFST